MYSIAFQDNTGLWVVIDDSTGKNISRGDSPLIAINLAIQKGMPSTFKDPLISQAETIANKNKEELDASIAAEIAARNAREAANSPPPGNLGGTIASDDARNDPNAATQIANQANLPTVKGSAETAVTNASLASTTQAGSSNTTSTNPTKKNVGTDPKPGTRLKNPLGNFSSYTYQLSLYMITPDAHSQFVANGRKDISTFAKANAGAYLILQSGGINNTLSQRPANMPYDYYIDDLRITNAISTQQTSTSSNITKITFNIVEPIGFSFTTKLKRAREALMKISKIPNIEKATNASKQFFVLGIRFQGYDVNGDIANASKYFSDDTFNTSPDASGVYERFYDILFEKVTFKLTGGSTVYSVTAKNIASEIGLHVARGTVDAIIDPYKYNPLEVYGSHAQIPLGLRFLMLDDINNSENRGGYINLPSNPADSTNIPYRGPQAWRDPSNNDSSWENQDGTDPVIAANSIIEWTGQTWATIWNPEDHTLEDAVIVGEDFAPTYIQNIRTGIKYKWDGAQWIKAFEGEYLPGEWNFKTVGG